MSLLPETTNFLCGDCAIFAITGKHWKASSYLFGSFQFVCNGHLLGDEQTVLLSASCMNLQSVIKNYDHALAEGFVVSTAQADFERLQAVLQDEDGEDSYPIELVTRYESLLITMNLGESMDGTSMFLLASKDHDRILWKNFDEQDVNEAYCKPGYVFAVFQECIVYIEQQTDQATTDRA